MSIKLPGSDGVISIDRQPRRIVSLVPSITEALFCYGLGPQVVGVTDWCVYPPEKVAHVPKVGGTKNPRIRAVMELQPDLVIANQEESRKIDVERLRNEGIIVWVTYPRTVAEGAALLRELPKLSLAAEDHLDEIEELNQFVASNAIGENCTTSVFCPIWRDPWMTIGADTYIHDMLKICGGRNVFGTHRDKRYPRVTIDEIALVNPQVILLPSEPYTFSQSDADELGRLSVEASRNNRIHLIDGTYLSWYGPRIGEAIKLLTPLLREISS